MVRFMIAKPARAKVDGAADDNSNVVSAISLACSACRSDCCVVKKACGESFISATRYDTHLRIFRIQSPKCVRWISSLEEKNKLDLET